MQIPIIAGMTAEDGSLRASYPVNLEPRAFASGISQGQLVSTRGAIEFATGPGVDRGGIAWNDVLYRVMGSSLVSVSSTGIVTTLGDVYNDGRPVGFDYGFDRLAIRSAGGLFYYDGTALTQVTDIDLGTVKDMCWMSGYFVTTDGTSIVITQLDDPMAVDPLKYGSAEEDPDMVVGVMRYQEELYAFGRNTIQPFQNVGGAGFPFASVAGAVIPYGAVGPDAKCYVRGTFAFVGGPRGEPLGVYVYQGGTAHRMSSREIDLLLNAEPSPSTILMEAREFSGEAHVLVHLTGQTVGVALDTSAKADDGAWFTLQSDAGPYRLRNAVWCYGANIVGDTLSPKLGKLTSADDRQFGTRYDWRFDGALLFSDGKPFLANDVELFGQFPTSPSTIYLSLTRDGVVWTNELARPLTGQRGQPVRWPIGARAQAMMALRWRGSGKAAISRAELSAEPMG